MVACRGDGEGAALAPGLAVRGVPEPALHGLRREVREQAPPQREAEAVVVQRRLVLAERGVPEEASAQAAT